MIHSSQPFETMFSIQPYQIVRNETSFRQMRRLDDQTPPFIESEKDIAQSLILPVAIQLPQGNVRNRLGHAIGGITGDRQLFQALFQRLGNRRPSDNQMSDLSQHLFFRVIFQGFFHLHGYHRSQIDPPGNSTGHRS